MRPNFKNIDIANDAFNVKHNPLPKGEVWKNAELIDIKPIYTRVWSTWSLLPVFLPSWVVPIR